MQDVEGQRIELRYVRDREKHEVDFLLLKNGKPWVLIEAKQGELKPSPSLTFFRERLPVPFAVQVTDGVESRRDVVPAARLFAGLP